MPYYNENTVYYRRLTASYGDVQLPPPGTTPDVVSSNPLPKPFAKDGSRGRGARSIPRSSPLYTRARARARLIAKIFTGADPHTILYIPREICAKLAPRADKCY